MTLAITPEHVIFIELNFSSRNSIFKVFFLLSSSEISGILRHPSENKKFSPYSSIIFGFINTC